jgi:hypothetical protein
VNSYSCPHGGGCTFTVQPRKHDTLSSLNAHWRKVHGRSAEDLYVTLFCGGVRPTCKCGCGGTVAFFGVHKGFGEWIRGHVSRVKNNWGHNDSAREKSLETRRGMFESGELTTWNAGLTKASDERVAAYGVAGSRSIQDSEHELQRRHDMMKNQWKRGNLYPLTGSAHSQWAGGVSALQSLCRSHMFRPWTYPRLVAAGFRCQTPGCESKGELHAHHNGERFSTVLRAVVQVLGEPGDDFAKKMAIAEAVTQYHVDRDVSGIVLCEACHAKAHAAEA